MSWAEVIIVNAPPSVTAPSLGPANPTSEDVLLCSGGEATDPDDDSTSLEYAWFIDGELQQDEHESALLPPLPSNVEITCANRAFDGQVHSEWKGSNAVSTTESLDTSGLLFITPKALDLGTALPGEIKQATVTVQNIGDGTLTVASATVEGSGFALETPLPLTLASEEEATLSVSFQTETPGLKKGKLILETDALNPNSGTVPLLGLGASPCLNVTSYLVDFGGVYPPATIEREVEISSCGALPLIIDSVKLDLVNDSPFGLDISEGPGPLPWNLEPGKKVTIRVQFSPTNASPIDADGKPIPHQTELTIGSNSPSSPTTLDVLGFASATGCPVAQIQSLEGTTVLPGTKITLSGADSFGIFGDPSMFTWSVSKVPDGQNIEALLPSPSSDVVTYDLNAAGLYEFHLKVFDQTTADGSPCGAPDAPCTEIIPSCSTAVAVIEAKEAIPLIVELTWDTPGDSNQQDTGPGKGGDLDLHMHNGQGQMPDYDGDGHPDSFFDQPADCYWFDVNPSWGAMGPLNDPVLVQEDADGAGPERIELPTPAAGLYTVGVHYWSAFEYGPSIPTIRVFYFETLVYESQGTPLQHGDLWEAVKITWPSGNVVPVFLGGGGPKILPEYPTLF